MTKILFFIPTLMHGGAEKVLVNLLNNLDKSKFDATLFCIFDVGINKNFLSNNIKYQFRFKNVFRGNSQLMKLFSPRFLYSFFIKEDYDIVISFLEGPAARIISGCNSKETKKICWVHTEFLNQKIVDKSFRNLEEAIQCYEKYDFVIAVSNDVKEAFKRNVTKKVPIKVLYNVNDTQNIVEKSKEIVGEIFDEKLINVCSIGKIVEVKGYERLIEVHKRLLDEGIVHRMIILGIGELKLKLEKKIRSMGVSDSFLLLGFHENPYKFLAKSDLYVCSSTREGFSTAVTEALVLGVPVVSTNVSGAKELLGENNEYGIVTENSTEGLYIGLKEILSEPKKLQYYKTLAQERGHFFSKEKTVKEVENLFDSVMHE